MVNMEFLKLRTIERFKNDYEPHNQYDESLEECLDDFIKRESIYAEDKIAFFNLAPADCLKLWMKWTDDLNTIKQSENPIADIADAALRCLCYNHIYEALDNFKTQKDREALEEMEIER